MYIRISGENFTKKLLDEVAALTDHALLRPSDVSYNKESKTVNIPIIRFPILKAGLFRNYKYDTKKPMKSLVVIRNVQKCEIDNKTEGKIDQIILLFGVTIKGNKVFASSAEEASGVTLYLMQMEFSELDIEINDTN